MRANWSLATHLHMHLIYVKRNKCSDLSLSVAQMGNTSTHQQRNLSPAILLHHNQKPDVCNLGKKCWLKIDMYNRYWKAILNCNTYLMVPPPPNTHVSFHKPKDKHNHTRTFEHLPVTNSTELPGYITKILM